MNSISLAIFKTKFHMKINKTIGNFRNTNKYRIVTFLDLKTHITVLLKPILSSILLQVLTIKSQDWYSHTKGHKFYKNNLHRLESTLFKLAHTFVYDVITTFIVPGGATTSPVTWRHLHLRQTMKAIWRHISSSATPSTLVWRHNTTTRKGSCWRIRVVTKGKHLRKEKLQKLTRMRYMLFLWAL